MKRFKNILYVAQASVEQGPALVRLASLAHSNQARLTVMEVIPERACGLAEYVGVKSSAALLESVCAQAHSELQARVAEYIPDVTPDVEVCTGIKFIEVIRAVLQHDYDLVIKPAENPDWVDRLFGSDDMHLLRKCPCPVWLMKASEQPGYQNVLAAVDFDPGALESAQAALNEQILSLASSLALADFAHLNLVHAWDVPEAGFVSMWADNPVDAEMNVLNVERRRHREGMQKQMDWLRNHLGEASFDYLAPRSHVLMGSPYKVIPAQVKALQADLVVMGTVARTGIPGFIIGNTAEAILDQLNCSVIAVKPPGFISPVQL